jgi:hypothetical protein
MAEDYFKQRAQRNLSLSASPSRKQDLRESGIFDRQKGKTFHME